MRTNFVGRSWVSAITHTPASGPFGPVTTPAMSVGPIGTPWAARGHAGRFAARPTIITWTNQRRIVFISPSVYVLNPCPPRGPQPCRPRDSSSPPVPLCAYAERGDDERASRSKDLGDLFFVPPLPKGEGDRGGGPD